MQRIKLLFAALLIALALVGVSQPASAACGFGSSISGGKCRGYITTTGTGTFTVPSDWVSSGATFECVGSGGYGAGVENYFTSDESGAGGQGGGYGKVTSPSNVSIGNSLSVQVGAAGSSVATFLKDNTSTIICQGDFGQNQSTNTYSGHTQTNTGATATFGGGASVSSAAGGGSGGGAAGGLSATGGSPSTPTSNNGSTGGSADSGGVSGGAGGTAPSGVGVAGNMGTEWDGTHGLGSGAGGGAYGVSGNNNGGNAGNAAGYGGGGGGGGEFTFMGTGTNGTRGVGFQGIIVITYMPSGSPPVTNRLMMHAIP